MTAILHNSAFPHDLDPLFASGAAQTSNGGTLTVTIHSDNEANGGPVSGIQLLAVPNPITPVSTGTGEADPNSIAVSYSGPGHVATLTFNASGLASEGGNVTGGQNGVDATNTYFNTVAPGVVFLPASVPFMVGTSFANSLAVSDVVATPSNQAGSPSNPGSSYWTLGLQFPNNNFVSGKALHFTIGRGEQHASDNSTIDDASGDLWGGGVLIPDATVIPNGMTFSGTMDDGSTFTGRIVNQIGHDYTPLDGYGFINAEAAVGTPVPPPVQFNAVSRKTHQSAGTFDIPLTGAPSIECRDGGPSGDYQVVFIFPTPLSSVGNAVVTTGAGRITAHGTQNGGLEYVCNLTGVTSAQRIVIALSDVIDTAGNSSGAISATLPVLVGDVNASGVVTSGDTNLCKAQALQPLTAENFRNDVNASGQITTGDTNVIKQHALNQLPPN